MSFQRLKQKIRAILRLASLFIIRMMISLRIYKIFPKNPKILECHEFPGCVRTSKLCIFASYSRKNLVEDYVFAYLAALSRCGFDIIFVTTADILAPSDIQRLGQFCTRVVRRENTGYDFGSWKAGLLDSGLDAFGYDQVLLTNDSYYAPLFPISEALNKPTSDIYGITDSFEIQYHLMSYFVLYTGKILKSEAFRQQWQDIRMIPTRLKTLIIYLYEVGMCQKFRKQGFSVNAYCRVEDLINQIGNVRLPLSRINTVHRYWKELIEKMRCPILKVDLFWRFFDPQGDESWRTIVRKTGYDENLILRHRQDKK